jgi:ribonuclease Z
MFKSPWIRGLLGLIAIVGLTVALLQTPAVQDWLFVRAVAGAVRVNPAILPETGHLKVVLCGTSAPPPSTQRAKACTLVMAGGHAFVVDTGPGSANRLSKWRFPFERLDAVLLTHFHSDHIGDLGEFRMQSWVAGRPGPLAVIGPDGVQDLVSGFNRAYGPDTSYRSGEHGLNAGAADLVAAPFGLASAEERTTHMASKIIYDADGVRITAFQVIHEPVYPAVGYRFDYGGRSVVVSGDTTLSPNLVHISKGADVLIHEAQSESMRQTFVKALAQGGSPKLAKVIAQIGNYHATPQQAATEANEASVRLLVFTHMGPIAPDNWILKQIFERGISDIRPRKTWIIGFDGLTLDLPAHSDEIRRGRLG